jgi:hypothetical protein
MAYTPTVWTNREVEKPRTYTMVDNGDGTITLTPSEGTVFVSGTPIDAVNMNKIETAIDSMDDTLTTQTARIQAGTKAATGNGTPSLTVELTFPTQFSTAPSLVASASISSLSCAVTNVNTTSADILVRHVDNGNWSSAITIRWIAIVP